MIAVTGMHRSGTSCITGLLVQCGLRLGTSHRVLTNPAVDNAKGHYENQGALEINASIIKHAEGDWDTLPPQEKIIHHGIRHREYIAQFGQTFDGDVFKDPRTSLTIAVWEQYCPQLDSVVFCVRSPWGVAQSLLRRNAMPFEVGIRLWFEYNVRFLLGVKRSKLIIVDYDNLNTHLGVELEYLCAGLALPLSAEQIDACVKGFYDPELNHDSMRNADTRTPLPEDVARLYEVLLSQTVKGKLAGRI